MQAQFFFPAFQSYPKTNQKEIQKFAVFSKSRLFVRPSYTIPKTKAEQNPACCC
jgi:hypothetical protein